MSSPDPTSVSNSTSQPTLYILYNAHSTLLGKLNYGYRKLRTSSSSSPACAACDITHGGLSLSETAGWTEAKRTLQEESGLKVVQRHIDEMSQGLKAWVEKEGVRMPAVVLGKGEAEGEGYRLVVSREELAGCKGEPKGLVRILGEKGVIGGGEAKSSL